MPPGRSAPTLQGTTALSEAVGLCLTCRSAGRCSRLVVLSSHERFLEKGGRANETDESGSRRHCGGLLGAGTGITGERIRFYVQQEGYRHAHATGLC